MTMQDRLRWQQLSAPDFRPAAALQQTSVDAMNKAFEAARATLTGLENSRQKGMDASAYAQSLQFRDPLKREEAFADGSIYGGYDPAKLSLANLQRIESDSATMLKGAEDRNTFSNTLANQEAYAANADQIGQAYTLSANGDHAGLVKNLAGLQGKMRPQAYAALVQDLQGRTTTGQSTLKGQYDHNQTLQDKADSEALIRLTQPFLGNLTSQGDLAAATRHFQGLVASGQMEARLLPKALSSLTEIFSRDGNTAGGFGSPEIKAALTAAQGAAFDQYATGALNGANMPELWTAPMAVGEITQDHPAMVGLFGLETKGGTAGNTAKNPGSTAFGKGQFLEGTWLGLLPKVAPELARGKTREQQLALRSDPELSSRMTIAYAQENAKVLSDAGLPITPETIYAMHHFGSGGGPKLVRAMMENPNASILDVVGKEAYEANRKNYLEHSSGRPLTVAELRQNWAGRLQGNSAFSSGEGQERTARVQDMTTMSRTQDLATNMDLAPVIAASSPQEMAKDITAVAQEAIGEGGIWAGVPLHKAVNELSRVMGMRPEGYTGTRTMAPSQALAMIRQYGAPGVDKTGVGGKIGGWFSDDLGTDSPKVTNDDKLRNAANQFFTEQQDFRQLALQSDARKLAATQAADQIPAQIAALRQQMRTVAASGSPGGMRAAEVLNRQIEQLEGQMEALQRYDLESLYGQGAVRSGAPLRNPAAADRALQNAAQPSSLPALAYAVAPIPALIANAASTPSKPGSASAPAPSAATRPAPTTGTPSLRATAAPRPAARAPASVTMLDGSAGQEVPNLSAPNSQARAEIPPAIQERAQTLIGQADGYHESRYASSMKLYMQKLADKDLRGRERQFALEGLQEVMAKMEASQTERLTREAAASAKKAAADAAIQRARAVPAGMGVLAKPPAAAPMPWDRYLPPSR